MKKILAICLFVFVFALAAAAQIASANTEQNYFTQAGESLEKEDFAATEKAARQMIRLNPQSGEGYAFLAVALSAQENSEAVGAARKALELLKRDSPFRKPLEQLLAEIGKQNGNSTIGESRSNQPSPQNFSTPTANQIAVKSNGACDKTIFGRSGLPAQFYQTYTYTNYVIVYKGKSTNTKGVGGSLTLGPNGSFDSELTIPGPYGKNSFKKSGTFCLDGENIVFN